MTPLQELDTNLVRHNSISSHASVKTAYDASRLPQGAPSAPSGVLSMLRTSTETGDLGAFSMNSGRFPKLPGGKNRNLTHRPRNVAPSRTSSQYSRHNSLQGSIKSARSQHSAQSTRSGRERPMPGEWPFAQYPFIGGQDRTQFQADARSSVAQESIRSLPLSNYDPLESSDRSQSLTHSAYPNGPAGMHRPMASLRSQPDFIPRSRTPQSQMPRFPPSSYRPTSPALSDTTGSAYNRRPPVRPLPGTRAYTASPLPRSHVMGGYQAPELPSAPRPSRTIEELRRPFLNGQLAREYHPVDETAPPLQAFRQPPYQGDIRMNRHAATVPTRPPQAPVSSHVIEPTNPARLATPDPAPYVGFVQRVKHALEERSTSDLPSTITSHSSTPVQDQVNALHRLDSPSAIDNTPLPSVVRSQQLDSDAPAPMNDPKEGSAVEAAEKLEKEQEPSQDTPTVKRLTRDLIKAGMDAMSDVLVGSDAADEIPSDSIKCDMESVPNLSIRNSFSSPEPDSLETTQSGIQDDATETQVEAPIGSEAPKCEDKPASHSSAVRSANPIAASSNIPSSPPAESYEWDERVQERSHRRTFPAESVSTRTVDRPFSLPLSSKDQDTERSVVDPESEDAADRNQGANANSVREDAGENQGGEVHIVNHQASFQPESEHRQWNEDDQTGRPTSTTTFDGPTRVTILTSSPSTSINILDERTNHDRRGLHSSLSTVPESEQERSLLSTTTSDALNITSLRNSLVSETSRRSLSGSDGLSAMKNFHFPLPELAEDSQEDASTTNLRMLGNRTPLLPGRGGFKDFRRNLRPPSKRIGPAEPLRSYFASGEKDSHNLPSFDFSHTDLTAKLNAALGFRNSRSLEELSHLKIEIPKPNPTLARPLSSKSMSHERYQSFFMLENRSSEEVHRRPLLSSATKSVGMDDKILTEIEQLSIPSVKNLSLRLSELFPSIRTDHTALDLDRVDAALNKTVRDIKGVNARKRVTGADCSFDDSGDGTVSSPLTRKGTETSKGSRVPKSLLPEHRNPLLNKELPPLPRGFESEGESAESDSEDYESARASPVSTDVERSGDGETDYRQDSDHQRGKLVSKSEANLSRLKKKGSGRTLRGSAETAPPLKRTDETYPWSDGSRTADVTLSTDRPETTHSSGTMPSRGRSMSSPPARRDNTLRVIRSMSPGFDADLVPNSDPVPSSQPHLSSKQDILRKLSRKKGKAPLVDHAEPAIDPRFFHPEEQIHRQSAVVPGDRYPTSALGAPPGLSIDESRSYFSDDSEDEERRVGRKRRRFTRLRGKRSFPSADSPNLSPMDNGSELRRTPNQESMVFVDAPYAPAEDPAQDKLPAGMSKAEFHAKRLVEKLRFLIFKGSEALKKIGGQKRRQVGSVTGDGE